ncbi:MAG: tyrosine-type recombinase/integrase, partial [Actinomycetota bacterium]
PAGRERSKSFRTKAEARSFLAAVETSKQRGEWSDPAGAKLRFEDFADEYVATLSHLRPGTKLKLEGHLRNHILPFFDRTPLGAIRPAEVRAWNVALQDDGLAPGTIAGVYRTFSRIMKTAVIDGLISRSPSIGIDLPKQTSHEEMRFLEPAQVEALADSIERRFKTLIFTASYTGMRWGELAALKVPRLNLLKGTVEVAESLSEVNGHLHTQPPKTGRSRTISLPRSLCEMIGEHLGHYPSEAGFVFSSSEGKPLRRNFYGRNFLPALVKSGLDPDLCVCDKRRGCDLRHRPLYRFHDLRHTCAALLIAQGAHPKEIQERLGHSTITLTFDRYGHLFPSLDERLRDGLDKMIRTGRFI